MLRRVLSRLNPFRGLPNPREVWGWGMFDLANQSFAILINTLFFPIYFQLVIVGDEGRGRLLWGAAAAGANLLVVLLGPILGAVADYKRGKKRVLLFTWLGCVAALLLLSRSGEGMVVYAIACFAFATVCYAAGENLVAALLPDIADSRRMARVSSLGWTMGYLGALLVLPLAILVAGPGDPSPSGYRAIVVLAALWFFVGALPTFLFVRERANGTPTPPSGANLVATGFARFFETIGDAARFKNVFRFLAAFLVYACGVQVIIYFAGIIAKNDFGFEGFKLAIFFLQITVTAGVGAFGVGWMQDRVGRKRALLITLGVWIVAALGALAMPRTPAFEWAFWTIGNLIGLGLGAIGAGSRSFFALLTPLHKSAEFFGLWGSAYKSAAVVGPLLYGVIAGTVGPRVALGVVLVFFVAGFVLLLRVDERGGRRDAIRAQRRAGWKSVEASDLAASARA